MNQYRRNLKAIKHKQKRQAKQKARKEQNRKQKIYIQGLINKDREMQEKVKEIIKKKNENIS